MFLFNITTEHLYTSFLCITLNINKLSAFLFFGGFVLHFSKKKTIKNCCLLHSKKQRSEQQQRTDLCLRSRQGTYYEC